MALIKRDDKKRMVFVRGKHEGEYVCDVVMEDPGYARWVYNEASEDLPQDIFHELQDEMEEAGLLSGRRKESPAE